MSKKFVDKTGRHVTLCPTRLVGLLVMALMWPLEHIGAQQLTANAPQQVAVGQQFRLTYTVNTHDVSNFQVGQIPTEGFEVLMGPSTSRQSSYTIVNGNTSQTMTITYTYILSPLKNGTYTIPPATITANGKQISSSPLKIQVVGTSAQGNGTNRQRQQSETRPAGSSISANDLFITATASKHRVVEQEPILLTYKVYTLVSLTQLDGKMPDLKGFHTQEVPLPQQKSFQIEQYNGRNYKTVTWSQYVMYPQMTGKLEIPSITFNGIVIQQDRSVDPFEAFFNGGSGYVEVKKQIKAPAIEIQVDPLPTRPANFSGAVGQFTVKAELDKTDVKSNDPITLKVVVRGTGNMKLIKEPVVQFPKDFDTYDAKITDKTHLTTRGVEGSMEYEYLAVPRHQGKYEIPAIEFTYFDPQTHQYKTLETESFALNVAKGENGTSTVQNFVNQEDIQLLANDIHHIKLGDSRQHPQGEFFFGSASYFACIAGLVVVLVVLCIVFRHRAKENADVVKSKGKRANKEATRRLKKSAKLMQANKPSEFYDEVLRALWGYVGDKLNMPVEQLSHDNITEQLQMRHIDDVTISQFVGAIDECEFERYAPGDPKGNMNKVYEKAMTAIEQIENGVKKGKRGAAVLLLLLCFMPLAANALTKAEADSAYVQGNYQQAIVQYNQLLEQGVNASLYYNLGNSYYRVDNITQAILAYERALQLSPGDADIRFNLQMARSKTVDKIVPASEMFFVTWYHSLVNLTSVNGWAWFALVTLAIAIALTLLYLFSDTVWVRKLGFYVGLLMFVCFILSNVFAWQQQRALSQRDGAIIIDSAVTVKSTPALSGTDLFVLHEGTKVQITDNTVEGWAAVSLPDGKQGWVMASQIEVI